MELQVIKNEVGEANHTKIASTIYAYCSTITPAFYVNKSVEQMKTEIRSIEFLTQNIPVNVLNKMCELAVKNYPIKKSQNNNLIFDIHYIMCFYENAEYLIRNHLNSFEEMFDEI